MDDQRQHAYYTEFYKFGFPVFPISAAHGTGITDLLDQAIAIAAPPALATQDTTAPYSVALVGRPNVGKSSLINTIINDDRVLVSPEAGTTRDAIQVPFTYQDTAYCLVDTAGMRKRSKQLTALDYYAWVRASDTIKTADCVVFLLEPEPFLSDHDKRLFTALCETARSILIVINKWDLVPRSDSTRRDFEKRARRMMPFIQYYPMIVGSALTGHNHHKILAAVPALVTRSRARIKTAAMNAFTRGVIATTPPPSKTGQPLRIFYVTQASSSPPTFIFFVNNKKLLSEPYQRFLERQLRDNFDLFGVPIRLFFKNRSKVVI